MSWERYSQRSRRWAKRRSDQELWDARLERGEKIADDLWGCLGWAPDEEATEEQKEAHARDVYELLACFLDLLREYRQVREWHRKLRDKYRKLRDYHNRKGASA